MLWMLQRVAAQGARRGEMGFKGNLVRIVPRWRAPPSPYHHAPAVVIITPPPPPRTQADEYLAEFGLKVKVYAYQTDKTAQVRTSCPHTKPDLLWPLPPLLLALTRSTGPVTHGTDNTAHRPLICTTTPHLTTNHTTPTTDPPDGNTDRKDGGASCNAASGARVGSTWISLACWGWGVKFCRRLPLPRKLASLTSLAAVPRPNAARI